MIGQIPYLNGGLFDLHQIELSCPDLNIPDEAFEQIFDLFDQYEWHLDTRDYATGKEISPDVLGYIFEKYINDRSSMGAYYTQEDITGYISRNTILPWLLENTKRIYPKAFETNGPIWSFLRNSGDAYIFDNVKHGVGVPLPEYISVGLETTKPDLLVRRRHWNELAPSEFALPGEIWREVIERRNRFEEARELLSSGGMTNVTDFITYNLDIVNFVTDLVDTIEDPFFIRAFYDSLEKISILDPTCGSGAFLFAALNILEPLYESCLNRMDDYLNHNYKGILDRKIKRYFDEKLEFIESNIHPSKHYFIYKSIILNNLYGVDIMREAVETAKLRLFLKLVSTVDPDYDKDNLGIEPLPDIDFNIKAGNSLIGYANEKEVDVALTNNLVTQLMIGKTKDAMLQVSKATARYKKAQLDGELLTEEFYQAKHDLSARVANLKNSLDSLLRFHDYNELSETDWNRNYFPFHWVSEFYSIMVDNGGFDIVIGNPPFLEKRQVNYNVYNYHTIDSMAIHGFCIERSYQICKSNSNISLIVPLSLVSTQRLNSVRKIIENNSTTYYSNFSWRPGKLFDTVNRALTIFVCIPNKSKKLQFTTKYIKWNSDNRCYLFDLIFYTESKNDLSSKINCIGKLGNKIENNIINKLSSSKYQITSLIRKSDNHVFYKSTGGLYWKVFTDFSPKFYINGVEGHSSREKTISVDNEKEAVKLMALLSSSTFWWWYTLFSTLRDLNPIDINNFYLPDKWSDIDILYDLGVKYKQGLIDTSSWIDRNQKTVGLTRIQSFKISKLKPIINEIDSVLAKYYGFTIEELDYIINYDIKYRMGIGNDCDDEIL
jgi:hypothetical protein